MSDSPCCEHLYANREGQAHLADEEIMMIDL
jgi:hypothetical protein